MVCGTFRRRWIGTIAITGIILSVVSVTVSGKKSDFVPGHLGIHITMVSPSDSIDFGLFEDLSIPRVAGCLVELVDKGSAAERAGLRAGDIIIAIGDSSLGGMSHQQVTDLIRSAGAGSDLTMSVLRMGANIQLAAVLDSVGSNIGLGAISIKYLRRNLWKFGMSLPDDVQGVFVVHIEPDGPAQRAGLQTGIILEGFGDDMWTCATTERCLNPNEAITVSYWRGCGSKWKKKHKKIEVEAGDQGRLAYSNFQGYAESDEMTEEHAPRTIVVDQSGSGDFLTPIAAILSASKGDVIMLREGEYSGFKVSKSITLIGEEGCVIKGSLLIFAPDARVENLTILPDTTLQPPRSTIWVSHANGVSMSGIRNVSGLVRVHLSESVTLDDSQLGCVEISSATVTLRRNVIAESEGPGVYVNYGSIVKLESNTVVGHTNSGVVVSDGAVSAYDNIIVRNGRCGIECAILGEYIGGYNNVSDNTCDYAYEKEPDNRFCGRGHYVSCSLGDRYLKAKTDISLDPLFVDPLERDYRLRPESPLVGSGSKGSYVGALPPAMDDFK